MKMIYFALRKALIKWVKFYLGINNIKGQTIINQNHLKLIICNLRIKKNVNPYFMPRYIVLPNKNPSQKCCFSAKWYQMNIDKVILYLKVGLFVVIKSICNRLKALQMIFSKILN